MKRRRGASIPGCAVLLSAVFSSVVLLSGCWNLNSPVDPAAEAFSGSLSLRIDDLRIEPATADVFGSSTTQFAVYVTFEDGSVADVTEEAVWRSTNVSVVSVSNTPGTRGEATPTGPGMATVEAEYLGVTTSQTGKCGQFTADTVFVSTTLGSDLTGNGSRTNPYQTIQKGIDEAVAAAPGGAAILVGAGVYGVTTPVNLAPAMSIYGGYNPSTWARDTTAYVTTIDNTSSASTTQASPDAAVAAGPGVDGSSRIDGFVLKGGNTGGLTGYSAGVYCDGGDPVITNNILNGGSGTSHAYGVLVMNGGAPRIEHNVIVGRESYDGDRSYGIHVVGGNPTIIANEIQGGPLGVTPHRSSGIYVNGASVSGAIANNWIHGGYGEEAYGLDVSNNATPRVWSNTINGGFAQGGFGIDATIALAIDTGSPNVVNNILFCDGGPHQYGVYEQAASSDPSNLQNNLLFDCPDGLYRNFDGTISTTAVQVNDWSRTTDDAGRTASGNASANPVFVDQPGGDWHLSGGSPVSATEGGFDLSGSSHYPTTGNPPIPVDFDRAHRSVPWSIGACEY